MKRLFPVASFLVMTAVAALAFAETDLDQFASRLAQIRSEVESLSTRVEDTKQSQRAATRSVAAQKADLEFQLQREERRIAQLDAQTNKQRERIAAASQGGEQLVPALTSSIAQLRERVAGGLPFKVDERLASIDELEQRMLAGNISAQLASVQLWSLVEDELRLGRENGLYRQIIELDGDEVLVEVARLGMVGMYFRAEDGRVGWVERRDDQWTWIPEQHEAGQRQIALLFDAMRKQIRTGYFELPGPVGELR